MLNTLPPVPGFTGPFSLKEFLLRHFSLEVCFEIRRTKFLGPVKPNCLHTDGSNQSVVLPNTPTCVVRIQLQSSGTFAVVVYLSRVAPAPPKLPTVRAECHACTEVKSYPSPWSTTRARKLSRGAFTQAVLAQPIWCSLLNKVGPSVANYLLAYCALVTQYEPDGGGLQVLGMPLYRSVPATRFPGRRGWLNCKRQTRSCDKTVEPLKKRVRMEQGELQGGHVSSTPGVLPPCVPLRGACELGRLDVPRRVLFGEDPISCRYAGSGAGASGHSTVSIPDRWLEELWLRRHPTSLAFVLHSTLPPSERRRATGAKRVREGGTSLYLVNRRTEQSARLFGLSNLPTNIIEPRLVHLPDVVLNSVFPFTLHAHVPALPGKEETSKTFEPCLCHSANLREGLRGVLKQLMSQCSEFDLRGFALRHSGHLEARFECCVRSGVEVRPADVIAPVPLIVSYLRDLLSRLRYTCGDATVHHRGEPCSDSSFWGADARSSTMVLDALSDSLCDWLNFGKRDHFPLHTFLERVPVGAIPWLRSFHTWRHTTSTTPTGTVPSKFLQGRFTPASPRARRSMLQQRVFLQLLHFLTQYVIPYLISRTFHVTWTTKNANNFLFVPQAVWVRWVRREVQKYRTPSPSLSLEPLRRCLASSAQQQRVSLGFKYDTLVVYSALRLLPDQKRLRPIAVIRRAYTRSLVKMARGIPSPHSAAQRMVKRLQSSPYVRASCEATAPTTPATSAKVDSVLRRNAKQDLRDEVLGECLCCLSCGLAERRRGRRGVHPSLGEYQEIRSFVECFRSYKDAHHCDRTLRTGKDAAQGGTEPQLRFSPVMITALRGDATRCYDRLPQAAALRAVDELLVHNKYYTLSLEALRPFSTVFPPTPSPDSSTMQRLASSQGTQRSCSTPMMRSSARPEGLPCSGGGLRRQVWRPTVSEVDFHKGALFDIPSGWIVTETEYASVGSGLSEAGGGAGPYPPKMRTCIEASVVREALHQHLCEHIVVLNDHVYVQHIGIAQGSAVSMLLCDVLLEAVDAALSELLSEHEEPSLFLRRVDDILVVTLSPVAGQRCLRAMQEGWPEVGYTCEPSKLLLCNGTHTVAWCGLLLHVNTGEVSVEWARLKASVQAIEAASHPGTIAQLISFTYRLVSIFRQRAPFTAFCCRINSKVRVIQTIYEMGLIWSHRVLGQVKLAVKKGKLLNSGLILAKPLNTYLSLLRRLCAQLHARLVSLNSRTELRPAEVNFCSVLALHRVLHRNLRQLLAKSTTTTPVGGPVGLIPSENRNKRFPIHKCDVSGRRLQRTRERRMWWMLASFVSQRLSRLRRRVAREVREVRPMPDCESTIVPPFTGMALVELLMSTDVQSIASNAAAAVRF